MRRVGALAVLVALVAAGCAAHLTPAPGARSVAGRGEGAETEHAGVRVVARMHAWRGFPRALESVVTPVLVTIENNGTAPLRVRYDLFALESGERRFPALGPYDVHGSVVESAPAYSSPRLYAPSPIFLRRHGFVRPFGWDPFYAPFYDPFWDMPLRQWVDLPTGDMVQQAVPESVVAPGGRVTGFVYFERLRKVERVSFVARLVDAATGREIGTVAIPFVAQ